MTVFLILLNLLLFPSQPHFPLGGPLSPVSAFFMPFMGNSSHDTFDFNWKYVYFPALVFWFCYLFIISVLHYSDKKC